VVDCLRDAFGHASRYREGTEWFLRVEFFLETRALKSRDFFVSGMAEPIIKELYFCGQGSASLRFEPTTDNENNNNKGTLIIAGIDGAVISTTSKEGARLHVEVDREKEPGAISDDGTQYRQEWRYEHVLCSLRHVNTWARGGVLSLESECMLDHSWLEVKLGSTWPEGNAVKMPSLPTFSYKYLQIIIDGVNGRLCGQQAAVERAHFVVEDNGTISGFTVSHSADMRHLSPTHHKAEFDVVLAPGCFIVS